MVKAQHISKTFGELKVLKDVSLTVNKGEVVSIVGQSGAGKTTLLQIIGTLDSPDVTADASLNINGKEIIVMKAKLMSAFRNEHIGFIFQFHQLLPEFTALENVCIPAYIAKKDKAPTEKRAKELLDFLGLSHRYDHKPNELSGGEQQRVAVARALINNPSLILADEPSGNLDTESADHLHKLFFKLRDEYNQTVIIVTHNEELADMADRKLVMKDGSFVTS
ncbi:ABC transporter ATP-binding protein [uncultured Dokdonia sp.]|uniref:ABC transporter ATP-binding protein n=1 Tax=uncultured Dokdonia sp. TaxID=575653 RepID=UPI00261BA630|nr:ABC transporter ATP-binding protein [uncultured Dokdonia sp.]